MDVRVQPGKYIVAVSGGVDSIVLLDLLSRQLGVELVVAHFDHGIRTDSAEDRVLVEKAAERYDLSFVYEEGRLGKEASEAEARLARYAFLERVRVEQGARAIITAHHQDDMLETAILNLLRGTGRKGLTALANRPTLLRPLLHIPKSELIAYAHKCHIVWHEDSTNTDVRYLRNYVRHQIMPRFEPDTKDALLKLIEQTRQTNQALDSALADLLVDNIGGATLDRRTFIQLPHAASKELLASWLRVSGIAQFDSKLIDRVTIAAKTQAPGATINLIGGANIRVLQHTLALERPER